MARVRTVVETDRTARRRAPVTPTFSDEEEQQARLSPGPAALEGKEGWDPPKINHELHRSPIEPDVEIVEPKNRPEDLIEPVPQIRGEVPYEIAYEKITPAEAARLVEFADSDPNFHQRPTSYKEVRRWMLLMETKRFVQWLPNGPVCIDPAGMLLNGKHRLQAVAQQKRSFGFVVFRNVPRWMFKFMDTGRPRTLNDIFKMAHGEMTKSQTGSTMRLAMRYEEMIRDARSPVGWREWAGQRDEHADVDAFLQNHEDLMDMYLVAEPVYRKAKIIIASLMVFRYYQTLAWPEGEQPLVEFWEGLQEGAMLAAGSPALVLREWTKDSFANKDFIKGKRELHLMKLLDAFATAMRGEKYRHGIKWAYGMSMPLPYHPDGPEIARKNILEGLGLPTP